jgi:hypothetical protein
MSLFTWQERCCGSFFFLSPQLLEHNAVWLEDLSELPKNFDAYTLWRVRLMYLYFVFSRRPPEFAKLWSTCPLKRGIIRHVVNAINQEMFTRKYLADFFFTDCLWMGIFTESNRKSVLVLLENTGRLSCYIKHQFCQAKCLVNRAFTLLTSNRKRRKSCRKRGFPNVYESYVSCVMPERQNLLTATKMERSRTNTINENIVNWLLYVEI